MEVPLIWNLSSKGKDCIRRRTIVVGQLKKTTKTTGDAERDSALNKWGTLRGNGCT